ncbi:hypothetical protein BJX66DRAFT_333635 [Aspergillus keveii]|uniref:F-box domain-containing protein n=1 Tax=Aspergillus keveii TaxID=714993 RepID=A0ABR4GJ24_9EURO
MHDPANLPPELFDPIIDLAICDRELTENHLCQLSLVNRRWHSFVFPRIYTKWTYDGAVHSFASLWSFVITVLRNPHIASMVRTLFISNWGFNPYQAIGEVFKHTLHDSEYIREAVRRLKVSGLEEQIFRDLERGDCRPLVAVLLISLPNVSTIEAHVPRSDPVLGTVLQWALEQQRSAQEEDGTSPPLACLKSLRLWGEVHVEVNSNRDDTPLFLRDIWPVLLFPRLEVLRLSEIDVEDVKELLQKLGMGEGSSNIRNLTITCYEKTRGTSEDLEALLYLFTRLNSFSFYLVDPGWYGPNYDDSKRCISNPDLWTFLARHHDTLEYLDIFRKPTGGSRYMGRLGPLTDFTRLTHLYIQPKVLFGTGETTDASLSQPLKETLPPSGSALQHLTIDCISGNNLLAVLDIYGDPRENMLLNRTLPALKALRLEADRAHLEELKPEPGWEAFRVSLENAGVAVGFDHGDCWHPRHAVIVGGRLPRGGTCPVLWKESFEMQEQGKIRWEEVRDLIDLRDYSEYSGRYY